MGYLDLKHLSSYTAANIKSFQIEEKQWSSWEAFMLKKIEGYDIPMIEFTYFYYFSVIVAAEFK